MLVFRYDKTFEGLLTAVFDAYFRRTFPDRLIGGCEPEPMFTEAVHPVITDTQKAGRVWQGLQRKLTGAPCRMLTHAWLSEEPGSDELLLRFIRKAFDVPRSIATNFADSDVMEVRRMALRVSKEGEQLRQFIRFQKASDGTFFAPVSPRHNALPLVGNHFRHRFGDQKWMIYDLRRHYGYYHDLHDVIEITLEKDPELLGGKLADELMAGDEKLFQRLWKSYFHALTIRERINPKLQRQHMPRRFWKYLAEMQ